MKPITSVIAKNKRRNNDSTFIEFITTSLDIQNQSSTILTGVFENTLQISNNTKSLSLLVSVLSALTSSMGSLVSVLSKNVEQQKNTAFFANALAKEKEYESKFLKEEKTKTPTQIVPKDETKKDFLATLLKWLGGTLLVGGTFKWLWENTEFKTKISSFFGGMFDSVIEGASELYTFVKTWINDAKNQEKIGNFFSGILDAIAKGFSLVTDLGSILVKEFEKEDSPLRKTVMGIVDSIWNFVKENPLIALGGALVAFGGLLPALTGALLLINSDILKAIGKLGLLSGAFAAGEWVGSKIREYLGEVGEEGRKEWRSQHETRLEKINQISDEKLRTGIQKQIKLELETTPNFPGESNLSKEERVVWSVFNRYEDKINEDKEKKDALEAQKKAEAGRQPKLTEAQTTTGMGPNLDGEVIPIPTSVPTAPTGMGPNLDGEIVSTPIPAPTTPTPVPTESTAMGPNLDGDANFVPTPIAETKEKLSVEEKKKPTKAESTGNAGRDLINKLLAEKNIGDGPLKDTIMGLAKTESSFNINAKGPLITNPKSAHYGTRAHGLFQIMPNTAIGMGYSQKDISNPEIAAKAGLEYFLGNYKKFGNLDEAVVAHHAGPGKVTEWRKTGVLTGGSKWITNQGYLNKVKKNAGIAKDITSDPVQTPEKIGKELPEIESPFKFKIEEPTREGESSTGEMDWFQNVIFDAMSKQGSSRMSIEKIRGMPRELINAPPKVSGNILNNQSSNLLASLLKIPEININAPNINQGQKTTPSKPPENTAVSLFDKEFIEMLTGRAVDIFA